MNKEIPVVLVKTWYELLIQTDDIEAKKKAEKMLMGAFGSQDAVADYLKKHKII
jgi:hypothetical protein|tara:strand:- start:78127 stop:78288 length:162 start_codon:yes stop_codon:yes gene_type:complete